MSSKPTTISSHLRFAPIQAKAGQVLVGLIRVYKLFISPFLGTKCRFYPSCSEYGTEAITKYGPVKGSIKTIGRICKCQPLHPGGVDLP